MAEGRTRGGGWIFLVLAGVAVGAFLFVNHASSPPGAPDALGTPFLLPSPIAHRSPVVEVARALMSTRLPPRSAPGMSTHCGNAGCCLTRVSTFGTQADITRVIAAFQHRGYAYAAPPLVAPVSGDPQTTGTYLRWLGERSGDAESWRLVNIATGGMNGRTHWTTVFQVSRAACPTSLRAPRSPRRSRRSAGASRRPPWRRS